MKARASLQVVACFAAPPCLEDQVVLLAADDDVPPPLTAASMEGCLLLSRSRHAQRLCSLLVPSCHGGKLNCGLLCKACLVGSG